jgi:hypothetical protein
MCVGWCELVGEEGECGSDLGSRGSVEAHGDAEALQVVRCPARSRLRRAARYLGSVVGVELLAIHCSAWRRAAVAPSQVVEVRGLVPIR